MILLRFYFWILKKFNDGEPSSQECGWAMDGYWRVMPNRVCSVVRLRQFGCSLEFIAHRRGYTRERTRQMARSGVRIAWQEYHSQRRNRKRTVRLPPYVE